MYGSYMYLLTSTDNCLGLFTNIVLMCTLVFGAVARKEDPVGTNMQMYAYLALCLLASSLSLRQDQ